MTPYAVGPGWTVYHADAAELLDLVDPAWHLITDPPYLGPPDPESGTHGRTQHREYVEADPSVIRGYVERCASSVVITGSVRSTMGIVRELPTARRILPIMQRAGVTTKYDPWSISATLAHVYGRRDRAGRRLREGFYNLVPADLGRRHHRAELPSSLGTYLAAGLPAGATVIDPYAGSGALLVGARLLGLELVAGELDERHVDRLARRLESDTASLWPAESA